jgi:quercetin dioxygenase-like cupin family protein
MKKLLFILVGMVSLSLSALESEVQFKNDEMCIVKVKMMPHEEIGEHRDEYPQIVIGLKGGTITRLEQDGSTTDVEFPTGEAVVCQADPLGEVHRAVNHSSEEIELLVIQLKGERDLEEAVIDEGMSRIKVGVKIDCQESPELQSFVASIPKKGATSLEEWQHSFIKSMLELVEVVKSGKISRSSWTADVDESQKS